VVQFQNSCAIKHKACRFKSSEHPLGSSLLYYRINCLTWIRWGCYIQIIIWKVVAYWNTNSLIFSLFGLALVMPRQVRISSLVGEGNLAALKVKLPRRWFHYACCGVFWREINERNFEDREKTVTKLNAFFFNSLFHWMAAYVCFHILVSVIFFLQKKKKFFFWLCFSCIRHVNLGAPFLMKFDYLPKILLTTQTNLGI